MAVDPEKKRSSGRTPGEEATKKASEEADQQTSLELPEERERRFQVPAFARMRMNWRGEDGAVMARVHATVEKTIQEAFADAYAIMFELYTVVREVELGDDDEPRLDAYGWPEWQQTPTGNYVEDWSKLTHKERERFLFQITTRMFDWKQRASEFWSESMMAKALWEDAFSIGFESLKPISATKPTEADRTARGRLSSREDRYFAIFVTYLSRRVDAIVDTMTLLGQRLRDVHVANGTR